MRQAKRRSQRTASEGEIRRQLVRFTWLRLVVVTTALFTTLLLDFVIKLDQLANIRTSPLYAVFAAAYAFSFLDIGLQALVRSPALTAAVQFGGDIVIETAMLQVLGFEGAVAFALVLFFLTIFVACTYFTRLQGALFATAALLLQVVVTAATYLGWFPEETLTGRRPMQEMGLQEMAFNLFIFMFTFYATAWLVGSRAQRLRAMGDRLESVTDDLQELQAFNELVIQGMNAGLVTTLMDGRVTFANPAAEAMLGSRLGEVRGAPLHALLGWSDRFADDTRPLDAGAPSHRFERDAEIRGGIRSIRVTASKLADRDGRVLGLLFLLEDVTDLRMLEGEVRTKEQMAAIGEMAAGIAHEIRNPLASISGSVQMLQRTLDLDGDQGRLMGIVLKESSRLDQTIGEFLDFARPRPSALRRVDLVELVRDTVTLLRNSEEVGPQHVLRAPAPQRIEAPVDPDRIRQVAWNLCKNALKAMPTGGVMTVEVREELPDVVMTVQDTGVGMSARTRERAFQPLSGEFEGGMGLGLAIVYRIVKDHGGRVSIQSEEGRGTRVEVRLPALPMAVAGGSAAVHEAS